MMLNTDQNHHIEDGDLVRLLDGECGFDEDSMLRQHLTVCHGCSSRYDSVSQLAQRFSTLFAAFDEQSQRHSGRPDRTSADKTRSSLKPWWSRGRARLIAAAAVVALALATASPVRALVVSGWEVLQSLFQGSGANSTSGQQTSSAVISFIPTQTRFVVELVHGQRSGRLTLFVDSLPTASARIVEGSRDDEIVVLANGLRIVNSSASTASYRLRVPPLVEIVEITIAGELIERYELRGEAIGSRWEIELRNSGS
jgi:hypothetical protein